MTPGRGGAQRENRRRGRATRPALTLAHPPAKSRHGPPPAARLPVFRDVRARRAGRRGALSRYDRVEIAPAKTSIFIGNVTLTLTPFARKHGLYHSDYHAKVFPYFFYNEKGWISIELPDESLRQLAQGQTIQFKGHGMSEDGDERLIEGRAVPADATTGKLKVRVFVSKRIQLIFNTTYRLARDTAGATPS